MSEVDANSGGCLAISTEPLCSKTRCQPSRILLCTLWDDVVCFPTAHVDAASLIACHRLALHFRWCTLRRPKCNREIRRFTF
jgi:hypothetical protein